MHLITRKNEAKGTTKGSAAISYFAESEGRDDSLNVSSLVCLVNEAVL